MYSGQYSGMYVWLPLGRNRGPGAPRPDRKCTLPFGPRVRRKRFGHPRKSYLLLFKTKVIIRLGHPCKTESYASQLRESRVRCLSRLSVMRSGISMCALDIRSVLSYFAWDILSSGNPTGPKVMSRSLSTCAQRTSRIRSTTAISGCRESGYIWIRCTPLP